MLNSRPVSSLRVSWRIRNFLSVLLLCLTMSFITACDMTSAKGNNISKKAETPPPFHQVDEVSLADARELAKPLDDDLRVNAEFSNTAAKPMKAALGLKTNALFSEELTNKDQRFDRLERVVQDLSNKIAKIEPAIHRLIKIDQDLNVLTSQLEILIKNDSNQMPNHFARNLDALVPAAGGADKPIQNTHVSVVKGAGVGEVQDRTPQILQGSVNVKAIRISDHANKTRIVIDSESRFEMSSELDNQEALFNMKAGVMMGGSKISNRSSVIEQVVMAQTGQDVNFLLKREVGEYKIGRIAPSANYPDYRTYIDLVY